MVEVIAVANQKGGVGKTTTTINLGTSLASFEKRVLIIDFDPQGNTTSGLGIDKNSLNNDIYDVIAKKTPAEKAVIKKHLDSLHIIPATMDLAGFDVEYSDYENREYILKSYMNEFAGNYDYCLIDCPPSLSLLTLNSLVFAHSVIIPVQCEFFSLEGVAQLLTTIDIIKKNFNPDLKIKGILMTMHDRRTNLSTQVLEEAKKYFGKYIFNTTISRSVRLGESPSHGKPIMLYDIRSVGSEQYLKLAEEIVVNGK